MNFALFCSCFALVLLLFCWWAKCAARSVCVRSSCGLRAAKKWGPKNGGTKSQVSPRTVGGGAARTNTLARAKIQFQSKARRVEAGGHSLPLTWPTYLASRHFNWPQLDTSLGGGPHTMAVNWAHTNERQMGAIEAKWATTGTQTGPSNTHTHTD